MTSPVEHTVLLNAPHGHEIPQGLLERSVGLVLERERAFGAEISVTFLPDAEILELNRRWLDHDWVPDVLAFALHDAGAPPIGDVYVGVEQAARQAEEHGVPRDEELVRLAVHGTLHVLGWEHPEADGEAREGPLHRRQEELLREALDGPGGAAS